MLWNKLIQATSAKKPIEYVGGYVLGTVGDNANVTVTLTSLTGGVDIKPSANDLILFFYTSGTTALAEPQPLMITGGYRKLFSLFSNDTYENFFTCYAKFASDSDTSVTIDTDGSLNGGQCFGVQVWRNVDCVALLDDTINTITTLNTARPTPPSITLVNDGSVAVIVGAGSHAVGSQTFSTSGLLNFLSAGGNDVDAESTIGIGYSTESISPARFNFSGKDSTSTACTAASFGIVQATKTQKPVIRSLASAQTYSTLTTTITINCPSNVSEGDLLVVCLSSNNNRTWTLDSEWVKELDASTTCDLCVGYKIATASEPSTYTFTTNGSAYLTGVVLCIQNGAFGGVGSVTSASSGTSLTINGVSVSADNSAVFCFGSKLTGQFTQDTSFNYKVITIGSTPRMTIDMDYFNVGLSNSASYTVPDVGAMAGVQFFVVPS